MPAQPPADIPHSNNQIFLLEYHYSIKPQLYALLKLKETVLNYLKRAVDVYNQAKESELKLR